MYWNCFDGGIMMFIPILVLIVIVVLVILLFKNKNFKLGNEENAMDILKKRYAKGEISEEEYKKMKSDLI